MRYILSTLALLGLAAPAFAAHDLGVPPGQAAATGIDRNRDGIINGKDYAPGQSAAEAAAVDNNGDGRMDYPVPGDPTSMEDGDSDGYATVYDPDEDSVPGGENSSTPLVTYDGNDYSGGNPSSNPDFDNDGVPDSGPRPDRSSSVVA